MLYSFTVAVNLVALGAAIWLGTYIVTRSPRSPVAWLAGLTLLSLGGYFFNILLALSPPPSPAMLTPWMHPLLWFWPEGAFEQGWGAWLQGWQITPAVVFWHHATLLMRYGRMNPWRWTRVIFGYVVAFAAILGQRYTNLAFTSVRGDSLYMTTIVQGPLYPLYMGLLLVFALLCLINLIRSARSAPTSLQRRQLELMAGATLIAALAALVGVVVDALNFQLPRVTLTILLGCAMFVIGIAVARYSALGEGRVIRSDFAYNGIAVLLVASLYFLVVWTSVKAYGVPSAALALVVVLAILTHSLMDVGRGLFDRVFYRRKTRELRVRLRMLAHHANMADELEESLSLALETLCRVIEASYALIVLFNNNGEDKVELAASFRWRRDPPTITPIELRADDVTRLPTGKLPMPLGDAALLVPLYSNEHQLGAMIMGSPEHAVSYSEADVDRLLDSSDRIADAIRDSRRESANLVRLAQAVNTAPLKLDLHPNLPERTVEEALRNLFDFAYLADTSLAESSLVKNELPQSQVTHLERGKAVHRLMLNALERMRPGTELPHDPPPREWYPYLILRDAYLNGVSNRDIMLKLYISEGTFNRTRRAAIRSLARALKEMDLAAA